MNFSIRPITLRNIVALAVIVFVFFLAFLPGILPEYFSSDSEEMISRLDDLKIDSELNNEIFYRSIAYLSFLGPTGLLTFALCISTFGICIALKNARSYSAICQIGFILFPPAILFLPRFQKETYIIIICYLVRVLISRFDEQWIWYCGTGILYIVYAIYIREYYAIIFATLIIFSILGRINIILSAVLSFMGVVVSFYLPQTVFQALQSPRDYINQGRIGIDLPGFRTAFMNALPPIDFASFIINYFYSAALLNFPFFFFGSFRDLFHTIYMCFLVYIVAHSFTARSASLRFIGRLVVAHTLVLWCFEPDVGSYLRHISSVFLYFCFLITYTDKPEGQLLLDHAPGSAGRRRSLVRSRPRSALWRPRAYEGQKPRHSGGR